MVKPQTCCCLLLLQGTSPAVQQQPAGEVLLVSDLCRDHAQLSVSVQRPAGRWPVGATTSALSKPHSMTEVQLSQHSLSLLANSTEFIKQLESFTTHLLPKYIELGCWHRCQSCRGVACWHREQVATRGSSSEGFLQQSKTVKAGTQLGKSSMAAFQGQGMLCLTAPRPVQALHGGAASATICSPHLWTQPPILCQRLPQLAQPAGIAQSHPVCHLLVGQTRSCRHGRALHVMCCRRAPGLVGQRPSLIFSCYQASTSLLVLVKGLLDRDGHHLFPCNSGGISM